MLKLLDGYDEDEESQMKGKNKKTKRAKSKPPGRRNAYTNTVVGKSKRELRRKKSED
jgi:hypothetical protein